MRQGVVADPGRPRGREFDELLVDFGRALRRAGVSVGPDRVRTFVAAVAQLDAGRRADVRAAGRAACCASPEELRVYDRVFEDFFAAGHRPFAQAVEVTVDVPVPAEPAGETGETGADGEPPAGSLASDAEALRRRDLAEVTDDDRAASAALVARIAVRPPLRRGRRARAHARGHLDRAATTRDLLRSGEVGRLRRRRRRPVPRRVVLLLDVSGSMRPYADAYLRFAHAVTAALPRTETFSVGTRATRLTPALTVRSVDVALGAVGALVPDWAGGTRLGDNLAHLIDHWGRRGPLRGTVVVVASDGWERGDAAELGRQMRRLRLLTHRVIWVNPHRGRPGYAARTAGMLAALPHVDDFVAGHRLADLEALAARLADPNDRDESARPVDPTRRRNPSA